MDCYSRLSVFSDTETIWARKGQVNILDYAVALCFIFRLCFNCVFTRSDSCLEVLENDTDLNNKLWKNFQNLLFNLVEQVSL